MSSSRRFVLVAAVAILILTGIAAVFLVGDPVDQMEPTGSRDSRDVRTSTEKRSSTVDEARLIRSDLSISGSVTDDDGAPLAGASVCAFVRSSPTPFCADSSSEGRYRIEQLSSDRYGMGASAKTHLPELREAMVDLMNGQSQPEIDFVLAKGAVAVTGRVLDRTGGSIAQAWVSLVRGLPVKSGADGAYELWVKAGPVAVAAEAEGYASSMESGTAPGEIDLRLMPESVLQGRVVERKTRKPVAAVVVMVYQFRSDSHERVHEDTSNAEGRFALRGLAAGQFEPRVASDGWFGASTQPISLGVMETKEIEIEVERAFRVSGRVVTKDSKPCARRAVIAEGSFEMETNPDADGSFVLDTVPPGETKVTAYCDDIKTEPLTIHVERDLEGIIISVPDAARLHGIVVDSSGAPVEQIFVRAQNNDGSKTEESWTWRDGTFRMSIPWSGEAEIGVTMGPGQLAFEGATVSRKLELGKEAEPVRLVVERAQFRGRVVTASGLSVPNATVVLRSSAFGSYAATDPEGRFLLERIVSGRHAIRVTDRFKNELKVQTGSEEVEVGTGTIERTLVVEDLDEKISGTVVDGKGAPVSEVTVVAIRGPEPNALRQMEFRGRRGALTGADGSFELDHLADDRYTVVAARTGLGSGQKDDVATGAEITIVLAEPGSLSGRVELADGKSLKQFQIELRAPPAPVSFNDALSISDDTGRFRIEHLDPGHYRIGVRAPEGIGSAVAEVVAGKETSGIVVRLEARGSIRGRLIDYESGRPITGVEIRAYARGPVRVSEEATSTDDGTFQIDGLPPGEVEIEAPSEHPRSGKYVYPARGPVVETIAGGIAEVPPIRVKKSPVRSNERAGFLAVYVEWPPRGRDGPVVTRVDEANPIDGLELGSVITQVDGVDVTGTNAYLFWVLTVVRAGDRVSLRLLDGRVAEGVARPRDL